MKRIISAVVALMLVISVIPMQTRAAQGGKLAAITFDDGPSAEYTPKLLDELKARGVKATFFMLGQNAQSNMDIVARAYNEGHEIASHSWDHPDLTGLSDSGVRNQLDSTVRVLSEGCSGVTDFLLRPPYGSTNSRVESLINVPMIYWSVDPEDWKYRDPDTVRSHIVDNTYDGAIILVHDIHGTSVDGALMAIDDLLDMGYEFVTVSELHRRRQIPLENGEWHYSCKPNGTDVGPIPAPEITCAAHGAKMLVTITGQSDAPIYYTTDGSTPKQNSAVYNGPFEASYDSTITAYCAYDTNGVRSETTTMLPGEGVVGEVPYIRLNNGNVEIGKTTEEGVIFYTVDGSPVSLSSAVYSGPFPMPKGAYVRAASGGGFMKLSPENVVYCSERGTMFADMEPGTWYFDPIDRLAEAGMMSGMGNNIYAPKTDLTRGMLVTMLYAYTDVKLSAGWKKTSPFPDVEQDEWYAEPVEWAYRNSIVTGYEDKTFRPGNKLTRQELSVIIDSFLTYRGNTLPRGASCSGKFGDYGMIHDWALSSVEALAQAGLLAGDGKNVKPISNATRAEVAAIICQMMDYEAAHPVRP